VRVLNLAEVGELSRQLEDGFVGVHISEIEEINAFLGKDLSHAPDVSIGAPVLLNYLVQIFSEVVLGASYYTKVWGSSFWEANWNLQLLELLMAVRVLHFFQNDAFLHLTDVFFLNYSQQVFK